MILSPEALYVQLGQLIAEMPDLAKPLGQDGGRWLGRAAILVDAVGDGIDPINFRIAADHLAGYGRETHAQKIETILYRALAKAELAAPTSAQGAFIPAGAELDAFAAVGRVLSAATEDILIVDPYSDSSALTAFAVQAPAGVSVRLLACAKSHKATLAPAATRWAVQFGSSRPLQVRLAASGALHDRFIQTDHATVWTLGQSLNGLAKRAHTTIIRVDAETAALKRDAYQAIWAEALPLAC